MTRLPETPEEWIRYYLEQRLRNIDAFCEQLEDRDYSKKEVIRLLKETAFF